MSSSTLEGWLNGAAVQESLGRYSKAAQWYAKAEDLAPGDPEIANALAWAQLKSGRTEEARMRFRSVLILRPRHARAHLGLGLARLKLGDTHGAVESFRNALQARPTLTLAHYYWAQAALALKDEAQAIQALRETALADSYFIEARYLLGRSYLRVNDFNEAWVQFTRVLDVDPENRRLQKYKEKVQPLLTKRPAELKRIARRAARALPQPSPDSIPGMALAQLRKPEILSNIRIGIGTTRIGNPIGRKAVQFTSSQPFKILGGKTGRVLAEGKAKEVWRLRVSHRPPYRCEVTNPIGRVVLAVQNPIRIKPAEPWRGTVTLKEIPYAKGYPWGGLSDLQVRGEVEVEATQALKGLKLINAVDIENYVQGVLASEMPIRSPLEALKAQAVVARTQAIYLKTTGRHHRKHGYDVCEGQHCQVYSGVAAESSLARQVVSATRGRVVTHKGRIANVIYSSNCGGHTQSGRDLKGWGNVRYWQGVPDRPVSEGRAGSGELPDSPWRLRLWLLNEPPAYCNGSSYVHPYHFRWVRVVEARDLEERILRKYGLGRLQGLKVLNRAPSGHVNAVLLQGTRKSVRVEREDRIRSFLGMGPLRSALFWLETERGPDGRPRFIFHGGGWGHGVGMCQSGAMGRAEAGLTYPEILQHYYRDTQLGTLAY